MGVFFAFSDENGEYQQNRTEKFVKSHPYFIRATYIIRGTEWKRLSQGYADLKGAHGLPLDKEIKWSYVWSLRNYQKDNRPIPENKDFYFLKDFDYHELIDFVKEAIGLLNELNYKKVIITVTYNRYCWSISEISLYKMHLQEHMQRIEMELQNSDGNLAVLFLDPISRKKNELLRNAYHLLYNEGDFIEKYTHIKDSLTFENSHQSVGVQLADYIAGCFSGFLKGYHRSIEMFCEAVDPHLRTSQGGDPFGYGIREVPRADNVRNIIRNIYQSCQ